MYNQYSYNENTYNGPHTLHVALLLDSTTLSESLTPFDVLKSLSDSLTLSEASVFSVSQSLADFIFMSEFIKKEITNKALYDTVRLNDWISINKPFVEYWHD